MNGRYTKGMRCQRIGTSLDIKVMDPTPTEKCVRDAKLSRLTTLVCTTKAYECLLCLTHGNVEVERSLENRKVLTSERGLLSDDSINAIRLTKDAI